MSIKKFNEMYNVNNISNLSNDIVLFNNFDLNESLTIWQNDILNSIKAKEINMLDTLKYKNDKLSIDDLSKSPEFINSLSSIGLKISPIYNTDDFETFTKLSMKFLFIYRIESDELENPIYILIQTWDNNKSNWSKSRCYKINDDIKKFYDKLSNKTIVISYNNDKFIYITSNSNEWNLQDIKKSNDIFKKVLDINELESILRLDNIKFEII